MSRTDGTASRRVRGRGPVFTRDSRHVAYRVPPPRSEVDALRREGKSGDELPGESLGVLSLAALEASPDGAEAEFTAGPIESFQVPEDGGSWIAYHLSEDPAEAEDGEAGSEGEGAESGGEEGAAAAGVEAAAEERSPEYEKRHQKDAGTPLVLRHLETGEEFSFPHALSYEVADSGSALAYAASTDEEGGDGVHWVDAATGAAAVVMEGEGHYRQIAFDESGGSLAFVSDAAEWDLDQPAFSLYRADAGGEAVLVAGTTTAGVPPGWWVSEHGDVSFSDDGGRLFFGTAPRPAPEPDEAPLERDEVRLDVWNWKDPYLQPMQLVRLDDERDRSYLAVALARAATAWCSSARRTCPTWRGRGTAGRISCWGRRTCRTGRSCRGTAATGTPTRWTPEPASGGSSPSACAGAAGWACRRAAPTPTGGTTATATGRPPRSTARPAPSA